MAPAAPKTLPAAVKPAIALREAWLAEAVRLLRPIFADAGFPIPDRVRVTCGWPCTGGRGGQRQRIGECWDAKASGDDHFEIFISPILDKPMDGDGILPVLVHELIHAAVGLKAGHKGAFVKAHHALGLKGKPTHSVAGDDFGARYASVLTALGTYPHAALNPSQSGHKKQGTRSLRCKCPGCGWAFRATQKWIDAGLPNCICGETFTAVDGPAAEEDANPEDEE